MEEQREWKILNNPINVEPPSVQRALDAVELLEKYLLFRDHPNLSRDRMDRINSEIQENHWQREQVQTKMTDYFE